MTIVLSKENQRKASWFVGPFFWAIQLALAFLVYPDKEFIIIVALGLISVVHGAMLIAKD